jgi:hypothetical protein
MPSSCGRQVCRSQRRATAIRSRRKAGSIRSVQKKPSHRRAALSDGADRSFCDWAALAPPPLSWLAAAVFQRTLRSRLSSRLGPGLGCAESGFCMSFDPDSAMYPASQGAEAALMMRSEAEGAAEPSLSPPPLNGPNPAAADWRLDAATLQPVPRRGRGSCLAWVGAAGRLAIGARTTLEGLFSHPLDPGLAPKTTTVASSPMAKGVQAVWASRAADCGSMGAAGQQVVSTGNSVAVRLIRRRADLETDLIELRTKTSQN